MRKLEKIGGACSIMNALVALGNVIVVVGIIGIDVAASPEHVAEMVKTTPVPLLLLESFKVLSAMTTIVTVFALNQHLRAIGASHVELGTIMGVLSAIILFAGALGGGAAIVFANLGNESHVSTQSSIYLSLNALINGLGLAAIFTLGIWCLLVCVAARTSQVLPLRLCHLGLIYGVASLLVIFLPPVTLLVLLLGLAWWTWLGISLLLNSMRILGNLDQRVVH